MSREIEISKEVRGKVIAYKQAFGSDFGTEVIKDLAAYCQIGLPSFVKREGEAADPLETAFLEGRKAVFYHINQILKLDLPAE